jgi:hypothetical protein
MALQVAAAREAGEHPLGLREDRAVVRICAEKAQVLVQPQHLARAREPRPGERAQQRELGHRSARAILEACRFQPAQQRDGRDRHGGGL